jgi:hypothetical protein
MVSKLDKVLEDQPLLACNLSMLGLLCMRREVDQQRIQRRVILWGGPCRVELSGDLHTFQSQCRQHDLERAGNTWRAGDKICLLRSPWLSKVWGVQTHARCSRQHLIPTAGQKERKIVRERAPTTMRTSNGAVN